MTRTRSATLTVQALAAHKKLPPEFLRQRCGLHEVDGAVAIPYWDLGGELIAHKRRTALSAREGSRWPAGVPLAAYGLWRLEEMREQGYLVLVEGESDCWALWHHSFPALGLPGSGTWGTLRPEHFAGIGKLYIYHEPDEGGEVFLHGVKDEKTGRRDRGGILRRLAEIGYTGQVYELRLDGVKDPADLQATAGWHFQAQMQRALETAQPALSAERNGHAANGVPRIEALPPLQRLLASELRALAAADKWLLKGLIPAEMVTIFSALPKAGKTTLLAHLLQALETDGWFCGQEVRAASVLCVTEESETIWADRRDKLRLADHCSFILRPFRLKPGMPDWLEFLKRLEGSLQERPAGLLVFDTLAKLWPVQNENDASEVTAALMPLQEMTYRLRLTLLLVHHLRKSEGLESMATRGSGGITAAVDSILELRRFNPKDRKDRRRVLHCDARHEDRLDELVIELEPDGNTYRAEGSRREVVTGDLVSVLMRLLPNEAPGTTLVEIMVQLDRENLNHGDKTVRGVLNHGAETGLWNRVGEGQKGSPFRYWRPL